MNPKLQPFLNEIWYSDALTLLGRLPDACIDAVITDPPYGVASKPSKNTTYADGPDGYDGTPENWWRTNKNPMEPIYNECRRVLKTGGASAWAMGVKFSDRFPEWFGNWAEWSFTRWFKRGRNAFGHYWIVQTKERQPILYPGARTLVVYDRKPDWRKGHPCPKSLPEMELVVKHLSRPGEIVLDCFSGLGTTLEAAKKLGRQYIGCDKCAKYVKLARWALATEQTQVPAGK